MPKSDFTEAVRSFLAEERRHSREHCKIAELEAYHLGAVSADRQEVMKEHLAVCEDCTILLLYAVSGPEDAEDGAELLDREVEESWSRVRPRLGRKAPEGDLLKSLLGGGRPGTEEALLLALAISRALGRYHEGGRAHPDLRAENIRVIGAGEVRLLERGFAPTPESWEIGYGRAADAAMIDLYCALSPEQIAGAEPEPRSNLFSLGVVLYELLTGVSPFRASTPLETAGRIVSLDPVPARELNPAIGAELSGLLERLLAKEPEDRPESAAPVVEAIESLLASPGSGRPEPRKEVPSSTCAAEEVDRLYDEIQALIQKEAADGQPRAEEIEGLYSRLRELQAIEARDFRARFEASLAMPIDAGAQILDRLRALREELEDLAASDLAADEADIS